MKFDFRPYHSADKVQGWVRRADAGGKVMQSEQRKGNQSVQVRNLVYAWLLGEYRRTVDGIGMQLRPWLSS